MWSTNSNADRMTGQGGRLKSNWHGCRKAVLCKEHVADDSVTEMTISEAHSEQRECLVHPMFTAAKLSHMA